MTWVAVVWNPDTASSGAVSDGWAPGVVVRRALADQGVYDNPAQFDAFVAGGSDADLEALATSTALVWAWRVEEHVPRPGAEACGVAMTSLMHRNPAMTHAEFTAHWTCNHAPLALRRHVGLHDYHQYVVTETLTSDAPEIDGVAVLGFRTRADFDERFFDSNDGRDEIMADVARFMDRPGRETTLVGPPDRHRPAGEPDRLRAPRQEDPRHGRVRFDTR